MAKTQQKSEILVWSGTREYERSNFTIATVALSDFSTSFAPSPIQTNTWKKAKTFWLQNCQMQQYCYGTTLIHALKSQKSKRWKRQLNDFFKMHYYFYCCCYLSLFPATFLVWSLWQQATLDHQHSSIVILLLTLLWSSPSLIITSS